MDDLLTILLIVLIGCLVYQCMKRSLREGVEGGEGGLVQSWADVIKQKIGKNESCKTGPLDGCNVKNWNNFSFPDIKDGDGKVIMSWNDLNQGQKNHQWVSFCSPKAELSPYSQNNQGYEICSLTCNYDRSVKKSDQAVLPSNRQPKCFECNSKTESCDTVFKGNANENNCNQNCKKTEPKKFKCTSNGTCTEDPDGKYPDENSCLTECEQTLEKYKCDMDSYKCTLDPSGTYDSKDSCQAACKKPDPKYKCDMDSYKCTQDPSGTYSSSDSCEAACKKPDPKYKCDMDSYKCTQDPSGTYSSSDSCEAACKKPDPKYKCDMDSYKCTQDPSGTYSSSDSCEAACKKSPGPQFQDECDSLCTDDSFNDSRPYCALPVAFNETSGIYTSLTNNWKRVQSLENKDPGTMSKSQLQNFESEVISLRNELCQSNKFPGPQARTQMVQPYSTKGLPTANQ